MLVKHERLQMGLFVFMTVPGLLCLHCCGCSLQRTPLVPMDYSECKYCCWLLRCPYDESQPEDTCRQILLGLKYTHLELYSHICMMEKF